MSVRLYIGNLPQNVNVKELEALLTSIGDGIKFKAVFDRDTKACRGFGFANVKDENVSNELIEKLNGYEFNGNKLRVERSERKDSNSSNSRRGTNSNNGNKGSNRKDVKKVVHSDAPIKEAPDPRWAGELSKLKDLLANQKTPA